MHTTLVALDLFAFVVWAVFGLFFRCGRVGLFHTVNMAAMLGCVGVSVEVCW